MTTEEISHLVVGDIRQARNMDNLDVNVIGNSTVQSVKYPCNFKFDLQTKADVFRYVWQCAINVVLSVILSIIVVAIFPILLIVYFLWRFPIKSRAWVSNVDCREYFWMRKHELDSTAVTRAVFVLRASQLTVGYLKDVLMNRILFVENASGEHLFPKLTCLIKSRFCGNYYWARNHNFDLDRHMQEHYISYSDSQHMNRLILQSVEGSVHRTRLWAVHLFHCTKTAAPDSHLQLLSPNDETAPNQCQMQAVCFVFHQSLLVDIDIVALLTHFFDRSATSVCQGVVQSALPTRLRSSVPSVVKTNWQLLWHVVFLFSSFGLLSFFYHVWAAGRQRLLEERHVSEAGRSAAQCSGARAVAGKNAVVSYRHTSGLAIERVKAYTKINHSDHLFLAMASGCVRLMLQRFGVLNPCNGVVVVDYAIDRYCVVPGRLAYFLNIESLLPRMWHYRRHYDEFHVGQLSFRSPLPPILAEVFRPISFFLLPRCLYVRLWTRLFDYSYGSVNIFNLQSDGGVDAFRLATAPICFAQILAPKPLYGPAINFCVHNGVIGVSIDINKVLVKEAQLMTAYVAEVIDFLESRVDPKRSMNLSEAKFRIQLICNNLDQLRRKLHELDPATCTAEQECTRFTLRDRIDMLDRFLMKFWLQVYCTFGDLMKPEEVRAMELMCQNSLAGGSVPDGSLPDGSLPDGSLLDGSIHDVNQTCPIDSPTIASADQLHLSAASLLTSDAV